MATFTALNGGSPKAPEAPSSNVETITVKSPAKEERSQEPQRVNGQSSIPEASKPSTEGPAPSQRESWASTTVDSRPSYQPTGYVDIEGSHKRKRSDSVEPRREHPVVVTSQERSPDTATQREPAPESASSSRDPYTPQQREYRQYGAGDESAQSRGEHNDSWYSREDRNPYDSQQHSASSTHGQSEEQIGEALRRAADADYPQTSPDGDDRSAVYGVSPFSSRDPVLQMDPKKRKRNFSNRTKTGCLTCRKRKKKCDEQKPECVNCIRGGFLCAGYPPQRGTGWQKPDNKPAAIPLESKDPSYVPPGAYGMPQQNPYSNQPGVVQKREPLSGHYRGPQPALRIDPPQGRPLMTDDDRQTASTLPSASAVSPDNKLSALSYGQANVFPTPVSAVSSAARDAPPFSAPKEYQRVPPLHDLSRTEPDTPHPNTLPQITILHPTRTNSPITHQQPPPQPQSQQGPPPPPPHTNAQVAALALSHTQFPPPSVTVTGARQRTQKEEMLAGRHYYPFDKELVLERERCSAACWRFNNSTNPNNGVSPNERARLFREILQPRDPIQISPTLASPVTNVGRVGDNVVVEAPFTCDYGYNISIGQNVIIGRNCTIIDTCEVKIGDNCHIGPNVSIYTATLPVDPKRRKGIEGPALGRGIIIEQDCWIGGGAIILPGRLIGKGSTVGAGAIVTKDVPPFTVVVGNPARVLRGVSS